MRPLFRHWVVVAALPLVSIAAACSSGQADLSRPAAQLNFGVKAAEMDLWREARFRFERAVQLDPDNSMALNNLAVAYEGSGDFEKARETYVRALKVDQANPYIQKNFSRFTEFYSRNRKREANDPTAKAAKPSESPSPAPSPAAPVSDPAPEQPAAPATPAPTPTGGTR
jgi:Flp pilus assembly protein TadD